MSRVLISLKSTTFIESLSFSNLSTESKLICCFVAAILHMELNYRDFILKSYEIWSEDCVNNSEVAPDLQHRTNKQLI